MKNMKGNNKHRNSKPIGRLILIVRKCVKISTRRDIVNTETDETLKKGPRLSGIITINPEYD